MADKQALFDATVAKLRETFADGFTTSVFRDNRRVHVAADKVLALLGTLKGMGFDLLVELGGADYLHYSGATDRYGVWYCLANTATAERIIVKTATNDPAPALPSVYALWKGSDWMEREVYDM